MEKKFKKGMKVKTWISNSLGTIEQVNKYTRELYIKYKGTPGYTVVSFDDPHIQIR